MSVQCRFDMVCAGESMPGAGDINGQTDGGELWVLRHWTMVPA